MSTKQINKPEQLPLFGETIQQKQKPKKPTKHEVNANTVRNWFREAIDMMIANRIILAENLTHSPAPAYGRDGKIAKMLLEAYGPETTQQAIMWLAKNWNQFNFKGLPSVGLLWTIRDTVFGAIQTKKPTLTSAEWHEEQESDFGW